MDAPGISIGAGKPSAAARVTSAAVDARSGDITPEERASALKDIERAPAILRPVLRRSVTDPNGFKKGLLANMPRVLFALVPVFGAIVAIWVATYVVRALRHVYRETLGKTIAKAVGIWMLYAMSVGVAMVGLVFWAASFT